MISEWIRQTGGTPSPQLRFIANRTYYPNINTTGNRYLQAQTRHVLSDVPAFFMLVFTPAYIATSGLEVNGLGNVTLTAGVAIDAAFTVPTQVTFSGSVQGTLLPSTLLVSDPIPMPLGATIGNPIFVRNWRDRGTSGAHAYLTDTGIIDSTNGEACSISASPIVDVTNGGGSVNNDHSQSWPGPCAIIGLTLKEALAIYGDSRAYGAKDSNNTSGARGPIQRAWAQSGLAMACTAVSGDRLMYAANNSQPLRVSLSQWSSRVVSAFGTNDISNGGTALQFMTDNTTFQGKFTKKYLFSTITPFTVTSSDGYTTTAGQSYTGSAIVNNTTRITTNTMLRLLTGVVDQSLYEETSFNSGFFRSTGGAWTADGTHENVNGSVVLATEGNLTAALLQ